MYIMEQSLLNTKLVTNKSTIIDVVSEYEKDKFIYRCTKLGLSVQEANGFITKRGSQYIIKIEDV